METQNRETMQPDGFEEALEAAGIEIIESEQLPEGIGATFSPRLSAPSTTDRNWLHVNKGGLNYCILISGKSCLPNCVGYAWGRWRELLGKKPKLSLGNAENWWSYADGYQRGQTPKLGAVACWRLGKAGVAADGAGHVAIVERINADGSVLFSNSAYGGRRFFLCTLKPPYYFGSGYVFQGFIYLPTTTTTKPSTSTTTVTTTYKVKKGDTLTKIAKAYGTTVTKIAQANGIKNINLISVGQVLTIPAVGAKYATYTVKSGDTLTQIAKKYKTTVTEIVALNKIANANLIWPGQKLKIRDNR